MRITAKEARAKADIITCKEACLDGVMNRIKDAANAGNYETRIYDDLPKEVSLRRLFCKENLEYIVLELERLGFKATATCNSCCLKIEW